MGSSKKALVALLFSLFLLPLQTWASSSAVPEVFRSAAEKVVAGFNARDPAPFTQAVDLDRLLDTALSGLLLEPKFVRPFRQGAKRGLSTKTAKQMIELMPDGGYAKLLRIKMDGDIGKALLRVDLGDQGNSYMDLHLAKFDNGTVKIVDWYSYATGELCTDTIRQTAAFASPTPTLIGKVFDIATNRKENADILLKLVRMRLNGKHQQMAQEFLALDEELRKSRLLNLFAFQSANMSGDMKLYQEVLANIERYFGADESMAFVLVDYYYLKGDYGKVLDTADRLLAAFGVEDASLVTIKANAFVEMGRAQDAAAQARHAIELEPEYEYAYLSLLTAQIGQKQFTQAVDTAAALEQRFSYDLSPQSLAGNEFYTEFAQSAEYREWKGVQ